MGKGDLPAHAEPQQNAWIPSPSLPPRQRPLFSRQYCKYGRGSSPGVCVCKSEAVMTASSTSKPANTPQRAAVDDPQRLLQFVFPHHLLQPVSPPILRQGTPVKRYQIMGSPAAALGRGDGAETRTSPFQLHPAVLNSLVLCSVRTCKYCAMCAPHSAFSFTAPSYKISPV